MPSIPEALQTAVQLQQSGQLTPAAHIYEQILQANPNHSDARHLLGLTRLQMGNPTEAVEHIQRACELKPHVGAFHSSLASAYGALGRHDDAVASCRRALEIDPQFGQAHFNLAVALRHLGRPDEAIASLRQALAIEPNNPQILYSLANALRGQGHLEEAAAHFQRTLEIDPNHASACINLGNVLHELGQVDRAIAALQRAGQLNADSVDAHYNLALALTDRGQLEEAVASYERAVACHPEHIASLNNLGALLIKLERTTDAIACLRRLVAMEPDHADGNCNLGRALVDNEQPEEAVLRLERVLELEPDHMAARNNLGNAKHKMGQLDEAEKLYRDVLRIRPDYVEAHCNLGLALEHQGKTAEAQHHYETALRCKPDDANAHFLRSMNILRNGNWDHGWLEYEWRWHATLPARSLGRPRWLGEPLNDKRLLLHAEQGFGDTILFMRFAPILKRQARLVMVVCQRALHPLLRKCEGVDQWFAQEDPLPSFDLHSPLLSVPAVLKTTLDSVPDQVPYLYADEQLIQAWRERLENFPDFKVGIAWQGNPRYRGDRYRSIPVSCFFPLASIPGVTLISLQKGDGTDQLAQAPESFRLVDFGDKLDAEAGAFMDTAAIMKNLDLVVTSDTAMAHLAGALGVPVWVALPYTPDWRWLLDRSDSPWYPTMRLFRQSSPGDWGRVFEEIRRALEGER